MANAFGYCEVCGDGLAAVSRFCGACEAVYRQAEHDALIIERLRSALGHYADADNWGTDAGGSFDFWRHGTLEGPAIARAALAAG